jgi:hypothetical protein
MTAFTLKIIALTSMFIDHTGCVFPEYFGYGINPLRIVGRIAFPIFVYLLAEGFRHTKSPLKYLARLGAFALVSEVFFDSAFGMDIDFFNDTNIFYTLFLGGAAISAYKEFVSFNKLIALLPVFGFMLTAEYLSADYGAYGVVFIFLMYAVKHEKARLGLMALLCVWQYVYSMHVLATLVTLIPVVLVFFYNGKRGRDMKWLFYAAYPVHLAVLWGIA